MREYFQEEPRYSVHFLNGKGECNEQDALIKVITFTNKKKPPEYHVKFYESGPNAGNPVNPNNSDSRFDRYQTYLWKKVWVEDYHSYLSFITKGGSYNLIVGLFSSKY